MAKKEVAIGQRPNPQAERWIQRGDQRTAVAAPAKADLYTARVSVDVTPALRARIKVAAITAGVTATELLRALLEREFLDGEQSR